MESLRQKGGVWLAISAVLAVLAIAGIAFDRFRSDEDLAKEYSAELSAQFQALLQDARAGNPVSLPCVKLTYRSGRLIRWEGTRWMPVNLDLRRQRTLPEQNLILLGSRYYYQERYSPADTPNVVRVILVPLYYAFETVNQYLSPYYFPGDLPGADQAQIRVRMHETAGSASVVVSTAEGLPVVGYDHFPFQEVRRPLRTLAMLLLMLSGLAAGVVVWLWARPQRRRRVWATLALMAATLLVRYLLSASQLPQTYLGAELFSSESVAFHPIFAPSLAELVLNVCTLALLAGAIYTLLQPRLERWFLWLVHTTGGAWISSVLVWTAVGGMLKGYFDLFNLIATNSQTNIQIANIFQTSGRAFLILAVLDLLLLVWCLVSLALVTGPALTLQRKAYARQNRFVQTFLLMGTLAFWFWGDPVNWFISSLALGALLYTVYRNRGRSLFKFDFTGLLVLLLACSLLATSGLVRYQNRLVRDNARFIAEKVIAQEGSTLAARFAFGMLNVRRDMASIVDHYKKIPGSNKQEFVRFLWEKYFKEKFEGSETGLFVYYANNKPVGSAPKRYPSFSPSLGVQLRDLGEQVDNDFYRLLNFDNTYNDLYIGEFSLTIDDTTELKGFVELGPPRSRGLLPALTLNEAGLKEARLINSMDYAIYLDRSLYKYQGRSSFEQEFKDSTAWLGADKPTGNGAFDYQLEMGNRRTVVVRYYPLPALDVVTSFSFTFYYFAALALLLLALPVVISRLVAGQKLGFQFPIRARIRFWLLLMSLIPLFAIIGLLTPSIRNRYQTQARQALTNETARLVRLISPEYQLLADPLTRNSAEEKAFVDKLKSYGELGGFDISLFNREGRMDLTSQMDLFSTGLISTLIDDGTLRKFRDEKLSHWVTEESIGKLTYLSGYSVISSRNQEPLGYVNVSYLARRDDIEDQVSNLISFLANIYFLLFLLVNLASVVVADTISKPLSVLRQRLSSVRLGAKPEPIAYESEDEIGDLVKSYNVMVGQLAESEKQLAQSQRELAWKQMARQVAHEIKNPLTPMKLSIQMLKRAWQERNLSRLETQFPRTMETLLQQIDSMVRISNSFSEFARMPEAEKTQVDLVQVLSHVSDLYASAEDIEWDIQLPEGPFCVVADRDQLSRAIQNSVLNAVQAMEGKGRIRLHMRLTEGGARVEIQDNGPGMPEEVQKRAFEPSFSTKNSGMGLGLAIVKRIIETSNGNIWFESRPGQGTTFFIDLPAAPADVAG